MLAHRLLGGSSSSLSVSCPSLGSALIAAARAHLWSSFRRCSASHLLTYPETIVSCLLGKSRHFPGPSPSKLWRTSPLQAVFTPPTPVLSLRSDLRSPSLSSQPRPPRRVSRQASRAGECCSALILCAGISPFCPPHPCGCALLRGSEASPFGHPQSLPAKGLPSMWKPFLLHSSLPEMQVPSLFFCLCFPFFLLPYPGTWGVFCLLGRLRSSASVQ